MNTQAERPWMTLENELVKLPGFFYCPLNTEGLIELSWTERRDIVYHQGIYTALLVKEDDVDFNCLMDNSNIPTHRRPDTEMPKGLGGILINLKGHPILKDSDVSVSILNRRGPEMDKLTKQWTDYIDRL